MKFLGTGRNGRTAHPDNDHATRRTGRRIPAERHDPASSRVKAIVGCFMPNETR